MATTADRILKALTIRNMTQTELAKRTGIAKSTISEYISGVYIPKSVNTYKIASVLNVREPWLMGLDVPMEREETRKETDLDFNNIHTLIARNGKKMSAEEKNDIIRKLLSDD